MSKVRVTYEYVVDLGQVSDEEFDDCVLEVYEEADPNAYDNAGHMVADVLVCDTFIGNGHPAITTTIRYETIEED